MPTGRVKSEMKHRMDINLENVDPLNATLTIAIAKEDYEPKYKEALNDLRKKGAFKGFRKGKTPLGYIRKVYGESALAETVTELLQKSITEYLNENKVNFLGQPLPADDQERINFDPKQLMDYTFKFDLGMAPDFEVKGLDATIKRHDIEVKSEQIDEEWDRYLKQLGTSVDAEDDVIEGDVLYLKATELNGGKPKEDGVEASFTMQIDDFADDDLRKKVLKMKKGDTFAYAPDNLEKDRDIVFVRKYHLGIEDQPDLEITNEFEAEIESVNRVVPAEINQEFFDKLFGEGKVTTEEEGRAEIEKGIKADMGRRADAVLYKNMQRSLMDNNNFDLPEAFLQRWLNTTRKEEEAVPSDEDVSDFLLDLKWQLIKDKISVANELKVENEEIQEGAYRRVYQYVGPYGDQETVQRLARAILEDRDQVERISREVMANKVFDVLRKSFNVEDEAISEEDFKVEADAVLQPMKMG
jgi:trigger factor